MQAIDINKITVDEIVLPVLQQQGISLSILRLDKIHPIITGNKWFKLRLYLEEVEKQNKETILTFGGAWSNHIVASAAVAQLYGYNSIGIIRGEEPTIYSATLNEAKKRGMQLHFISRENYKVKKVPNEIELSGVYIIPEGGYGNIGAAGAATILDNFDKKKYTHFCCAAGTGTMAAGVLGAINHTQQLIVYSVLKGHNQLKGEIEKLTSTVGNNIVIENDFHFGGYAKKNTELLDFMNDFYKKTTVPSDFVYTGKFFYGLMEYIKRGYFQKGSKILAIHSGGLQGNQSLDKGSLIF